MEAGRRNPIDDLRLGMTFPGQCRHLGTHPVGQDQRGGKRDEQQGQQRTAAEQGSVVNAHGFSHGFNFRDAYGQGRIEEAARATVNRLAQSTWPGAVTQAGISAQANPRAVPMHSAEWIYLSIRINPTFIRQGASREDGAVETHRANTHAPTLSMPHSCLRWAAPCASPA